MNKEWTGDDDAVVREFGPKISVQRLAVRLKRSGVIDKITCKVVGCRDHQSGAPDAPTAHGVLSNELHKEGRTRFKRN